MKKKLLLTLAVSFGCCAGYIPEDFLDFYEAKEGYVKFSYGGRSVDLFSKYHTGYFEVDSIESERLKEFLLNSFGDHEASEITAKLVSGTEIKEDCQYVSIVCETKNEEINIKVNTDSKVVNMYVGSDFYKPEDPSDVIEITSSDFAFVSDYRFSYNLNNTKDQDDEWVSNDNYYSELNTSIGTGDRYFYLGLSSNEMESTVDDAYLGGFFGASSVKAGYMSESSLNESNNALYSLSSGSGGKFLGLSVEKEKKLKRKGESNNYLTIYAPTDSTLVKITKDGKEIYQSELVSGPNHIDLNQLPSGRYVAKIELSVNGVDYKTYQESIVNNVRAKYKVGESFYGASFYNYENETKNNESQLVGKFYAETRLTDSLDMFGTVFYGDKVVYAGRASYFFDNDISLGSDLTLVNSQVASMAGNISIYDFNVTYVENLLNEDELAGFTSSLVGSESKSISASVNQSVYGANLNLMFNHYSSSDDSSDRINYSISKRWSDLTASLNGNYLLSGKTKDDYFVGLNLSYALGTDSSIIFNQSSYNGNYSAESQYSNKLVNEDGITSIVSLGYKYLDKSKDSYYIKSSNSLNGDLTSGYFNTRAGNRSSSINTSLRGKVIGTSSGIHVTGNSYHKSSYMVVDANEKTRDALVVKMSTPSRDGYSTPVGDKELFSIDNFDEHKITFGSKDENLVIHSPTIYRLTSGENSVFKVDVDSYSATIVFGEIQNVSDSVSCEDCIDFEIDNNGFFLAKVESNKSFSMLNGEKTCEVQGVIFSNYAVNLGSLECK